MDPADPVVHSTASVGSLCATFVSDLDVSAASISVFGLGRTHSTVCVSDEWAARLDSLQFELGEGPRWEVRTTNTPALYPDLTSATPSGWPMFHEAAVAHGAGALFAFPMVMGAAMVGVVDLYCRYPHLADRDFISHATLLSGQVASSAVQRALHSAEDHRSIETLIAPALRREVHRATGMIVSQLHVSATEAFSRLQGHAFATGMPIGEIAHDVVERVLNFSELPD